MINSASDKGMHKAWPFVCSLGLLVSSNVYVVQWVAFIACQEVQTIRKCHNLYVLVRTGKDVGLQEVVLLWYNCEVLYQNEAYVTFFRK